MSGLISATVGSLYRAHQGNVSDKWELYLDVYEELFCGIKNEALQLVEIGVQNGGSLEIWARYFSEALAIVGCDRDPRCAELEFSDPRISIVVGDATRNETVPNVLERAGLPRIVIDDGSHLTEEIVRAFANFFPTLAYDGLYIVEDLHCSYWETFQGGLFDPHSSISFFKFLADIVNREHWGTSETRINFLAAFAHRYGCTLDEEVLESIHSVEFRNSLCVIRKRPAARNRLGRRVVAGRSEPVDVVAPWLKGQPLIAPDQSGNRWSGRPVSIEEEFERQKHRADDLHNEVANLTLALAAYESEIAACRKDTALHLEQIANLSAELRHAKSSVWRRLMSLLGNLARSPSK